MSNKSVLLRGDCLEILKELPSDSVDSLITDPPAGISFMGKAWDEDKGGRKQWIAWMSSVMVECLRVLKPGAHGLVWAIPRTSHWTATALEDAGFEIRDVVTHLFGSGFPKSHNIGKSTGDKRFEGFGTALKPAAEMWILIRKPISEKTVAANTLKHGTGGINIDASRIGDGHNQGRFPANLVLSHKADCIEVGTKKVKGTNPSGPNHGKKTSLFNMGNGNNGITYAQEDGTEMVALFECTSGCAVAQLDKQSEGVSRFFYQSKASKKDKGADNTHPTVKSSALMSYLIKLITPSEGVVLDPFMGSGSTGVSAIKEGFMFIGIEKEQEYYDISLKRIS